MKKMISSLINSKLSREQMMRVKGGGDDNEFEGDSKCWTCTKNSDCSALCVSRTCNKVVEACLG